MNFAGTHKNIHWFSAEAEGERYNLPNLNCFSLSVRSSDTVLLAVKWPLQIWDCSVISI